MDGPAKGSTRVSPLGWAAFLGASWTWVIGMYLPILLIRDLGVGGYLVFAVPNVVGAAAMGWVLKSSEASARLVDRHRAACAAFSAVTLGYHLYWLAWIGGWAAMRWSLRVEFAVACFVLALAVLAGTRLVRSAASARVLAMAVMTISLAAMLVFLLSGDGASPGVSARFESIGLTSDALWMLPVSTLGFALCPYLDLTFNRARQACPTPAASRVAFGVGFGVCFALMIVFTMLYAGPMVGYVDGSSGEGVVIPAMIAAALGVHIALQWLFTVSVHSREIDAEAGRWRWMRGLAMPACAVAGLAGAMLAEQRWFGMAPGEVGYRVLLSFYGLVFPAYVWINVIDLGTRRMRVATRRSLAVTAAAIALAAPFYFVGFIMRAEPWLAPGFLIVILAKLAAGREDRVRPLPSA